MTRPTTAAGLRNRRAGTLPLASRVAPAAVERKGGENPPPPAKTPPLPLALSLPSISTLLSMTALLPRLLCVPGSIRITSPSSAAARASCRERKLVCRRRRRSLDGAGEDDGGRRAAKAKAFPFPFPFPFPPPLLPLLLQILRCEAPSSSSSSSDSSSRGGAGRPSHSEPDSAGRTFFRLIFFSFFFFRRFFFSFPDVERGGELFLSSRLTSKTAPSKPSNLPS